MEYRSPYPTLPNSQVLPLAAGALAIGIFVADVFTPLGITGAALYAIVVLMASRFLQARGILLVSGACVALTVLVYFLQHGETDGSALVRGLVSLSAVGVTTFLVLQNQAAIKALHRQADLLDVIHDAVFVRNMDDIITYWNHGAKNLYGWEAADAVGSTSHDLLATNFPAPLEEILRMTLSSDLWEGELVQRKRDGTRVIVASRWSVQRDQRGRPVAILETNNDISERKRAEEALGRQADLLEQTHDAILVWEFPGTITYWNRGAELLYGYSRADALGRLSHDLLRTEHRMAGELFETLLDRQGTWAGELTQTTSDGKKVIVESRHVLIREADGRRFVLETNHDISERKRAEVELKRSEAYLAEAQRLSHTGSFGWRVSSGEIFWSRESFRILGYDENGSPSIDKIFQRIHPEDLAFVQQTLDRAAHEGNDIDFGHRLLMPDGSVKHLHVVGRPTRDEMGRLEYVGALMDVTAAKEAEEALRESEQRFRDYAETASDWLWETGPDHRFTRVSEQLDDIGIAPSSRIGATRWEFATDVESEPEKWRAHWARLEARQSFRNFVYSGVRGDGSVMYVQTSGKPFFDAKGRFLGYRGVSSDVTAAVRADQAEEALRKAQAELAHVTRVSTLGELAASIAHEVNQPLAAIVTNGEVSLRWLDRGAPDLNEVREAVGDMVGNARRASDVIQRLRVLYKRTEPQKEPLEIDRLIGEAVSLMQGDLRSHGVSLRLELAPALPEVSGDPVQLQQVIINLAINGTDAIAAVDDGPRDLTIRSRQESLREIVVEVQDSGTGIDPGDEERIFDAFFTTKRDGMGMGLSICRSIIEGHGGRLWASRDAQRGATFHFTLPVHQRAEP